jgi:hypothetical protein
MRYGISACGVFFATVFSVSDLLFWVDFIASGALSIQYFTRSCLFKAVPKERMDRLF